jgi:hypothetical protein
MGYWVSAIVAKREVLERHRSQYEWARVAPLEQEFGLLPIVEATWDLVNVQVTEFLREVGAESSRPSDVRYDIRKLCWALTDWLEAMSRDGPVAVVQVMCHGGDCEHGAAVWKDGRRTHGPAVMESIDRSFDDAVNQALRLIGVEVSGSYDAFAAVGLPERRHREDWEAVAT